MYVPSIIVAFMTDGTEDSLLCVLVLTNAKIEIEVCVSCRHFTLIEDILTLISQIEHEAAIILNTEMVVEICTK